MKKTVIVAFKVLKNKYEVEVVEQINYQNFPIYQNTMNLNFECFKYTTFSNFIKSEKIKIEKLVQGKINDAIIVFDPNIAEKFANKILRIDSQENLSFNFAQITKTVINRFKKLNLHLCDIKKLNDAKNEYKVSLVDEEFVLMITKALENNQINLAKLYPLNNLMVNQQKNDENGVVTFLSLENNYLEIKTIKENLVIQNLKVSDLGLNNLLLAVANQKQIKLDLSFHLVNCVANEQIVDKIVSEEIASFQKQLFKAIILSQQQLNITLDQNIQLVMNSKLSLFKNTLSKFNTNLIANEIVWFKPLNLISNELQNLLNEINSENLFDFFMDDVITNEFFTIEINPSYQDKEMIWNEFNLL